MEKYVVIEVTAGGFCSVCTPNNRSLSLLEATALCRISNAHGEGNKYYIAKLEEA